MEVHKHPPTTTTSLWDDSLVPIYFGEDEAVVAGMPGVLGSVLHGVEEEHRHDLSHAAA